MGLKTAFNADELSGVYGCVFKPKEAGDECHVSLAIAAGYILMGELMPKAKPPHPFHSSVERLGFIMGVMKDRYGMPMLESAAGTTLDHLGMPALPEDATDHPKPRTHKPPAIEAKVALTGDQTKSVESAMDAEMRRMYPHLYPADEGG